MSYNGTGQPKQTRRILVVRLGAIGDIVHTLPAVARLKCSLAGAEITWAVEPRWKPLIEGNPFVDHILEWPLSIWRRQPLSIETWRDLRCRRKKLRQARFDEAVDFQGLLKSAAVTFFSRAERVWGFSRRLVRERLAASFYSHRVDAAADHVVDRNLELAAELGGTNGPVAFPLPPGRLEASLPEGEFVLVSPFAGWKAKEWPQERYAQLAELLWSRRRMPLVIDCAEADRERAEAIRDAAPPGACAVHVSSLPGLIAATRRARAVLGVDSGPLHIAAALSKPGVALFGPTDPKRNGPYGGSFQVLRSPQAETTYKRENRVHPSMEALLPEQVWRELDRVLAESSSGAREAAVSGG